MLKNTRDIQRHSFHIVDPSPWPFISAISALFLTFGLVCYMHGYGFNGGSFFLTFGFCMLIISMDGWWKTVCDEAVKGHHTSVVSTGLRMGMLLFIISEVMFFFAFFWAFFHASLNPSIAIGAVWPPALLTVLDPWKVPLLNTFLLLSSGASITWAHHEIICGSRVSAVYSLGYTILLAIIFTLLQQFEYKTAPFNISDGIYGSSFFMATGFHGFHVCVGTCFLIVCFLRLASGQFARQHHLGFEAAAWYWHFVDVVWLFLFLTIYWWGN